MAKQLNLAKDDFGSCLLWWITFGWLIFICFKIYNGAIPKDLNEFGDFIAGVSAPLAFFWLVRGFYQQGKGLEQNSKALNLQAMELSSSTKALNLQVLEQKNMLEVTKQQIKINLEQNDFDKFYQKKQLQPFFHINHLKTSECFLFKFMGDYLLEIKFSIMNSRATCRSIFFTYTFSDGLDCLNIFQEKGLDVFVGNQEPYEIILNFKQKIDFNEENKCKLILIINYFDALDQIQYQPINLNFKKINNKLVFDHYVWGSQTLY